MYTAKIIDIGELVPAFEEENLVILFGPNVPDELKSICVIHEELTAEENPLKPGGHISFGNDSYEIVDVGNLANKNFEELGHISVYFREGDNEILPGAIQVKPAKFPTLSVGDEITISRN